MRLKTKLKMNKIQAFLIIIVIASGCDSHKNSSKRVPVARAGSAVLYSDQLPGIQSGTSSTDSTAVVQDFINKWARKNLMFQKAEENLSPEVKAEINRQLEETKSDLTIYQYQRQMMLEKMDTIISDTEMENYYITNSQNFILGFNIVKA